jgi:hypothetical protein
VVEFLPIDTWLPHFMLSNLPKAPTSLQVGVVNCRVRLQWNDNADNETHFKVWMQGLGMPARVIATLEGSPVTGPAWYEFASPQVGIYIFWVEAVNGLGGQPSEIKGVGVPYDNKCPASLATHLEIETLDMNVPGGYDRVYCYLSLESAPEARIPSDGSAFLQVTDGWGNIANWAAGDKKILLPIPTDDEVTLSGECWGWQGTALNKLGAFQASTPRARWDGSRQTLASANFTIDYRITPFGSVDSAGTYAFHDYTIDVPYGLWLVIDPWRPILYWSWEGDPAKITGFTIFMNGNSLMQVGPSARDATIRLPTHCGAIYEFKVAANSGAAQSPPSAPLKHEQRPCPVYAEIKFEKIRFSCLDDGDAPAIPSPIYDFECGSGGWNNDMIEAYYWLHANGREKYFGDVWIPCCAEHSFNELGSLSPQRNKYTSYDTFVVPIDWRNPTLRFGLHMKDSDPWWDADDHICAVGKDLAMSDQDWANYEERFELDCHSRDANGVVTVQVKGFTSPDILIIPSQ